jgi:amidase
MCNARVLTKSRKTGLVQLIRHRASANVPRRLLILMFFLSAIVTKETFAMTHADLSSLISNGDAIALQRALAEGLVSSETLTASYLDRIKRHDGDYRAVLALNPNALADARAADIARRNGRQGALLGLPVLIKDNIETKELPTTAGSLALKDNRTERDAPLIQQLRRAGAIILGKTNLSEWANFRSERSSSGWSAIGGQTRNPYDIRRTPCGSSSGSGAAVASRFAPFAVGTETNGSIVCPSHVQGLVGFKPTVGLVSQQHIVPISASQDTAGPMAINVASARLLLLGMADQDLTVSLPAPTSKFRLGVISSATGYHEGVDLTFGNALSKLKTANIQLVENLSLKPSYEEFSNDTYLVLLREFQVGLNAYLAGLPRPTPIRTLEDLIAFNRAHADEELLYFPQDILEQAAALTDVDEPRYLAARERIQRETREAIRTLLGEHQLDAIIAPSGGPAWSIDQITGDRFLGGFSTYAAVSGFPHLTLPMGQVFHLPVGLSVVGEAGKDLEVLSIGEAIEDILSVKVAPEWVIENP